MLIVARGCVKQYSCRFTDFAAPAVPKPWWEPPNRAPCVPAARTDGSIPRQQTTAPSALAARLPPHSPPNPTFALLAEYRGLPVSRPAEHPLVARISSVDASVRTRPAKPVDLLAKPRATGRCEARVAVLTERRRRSAHAAPILQHSGTLMRLGRPCVMGLCRSLLPLAFDLEKSPDIVGARLTARATRAHPTSSWHWSRIGMGLLCAQKVLATSGIFGS